MALQVEDFQVAFRNYQKFRSRSRARAICFGCAEFAAGVLLFYKFVAPMIYK